MLRNWTFQHGNYSEMRQKSQDGSKRNARQEKRDEEFDKFDLELNIKTKTQIRGICILFIASTFTKNQFTWTCNKKYFEQEKQFSHCLFQSSTEQLCSMYIAIYQMSMDSIWWVSSYPFFASRFMHSSSHSVSFAWRRMQRACSCYGEGGGRSPSENELDYRTIYVELEVWSPLNDNPAKQRHFNYSIFIMQNVCDHGL